MVCGLPPQGLPALLRDQMPADCSAVWKGWVIPRRPSLYGAVARGALPADCPSHLQLDWQQPGSLFISISQEGDGRSLQGNGDRQRVHWRQALVELEPWPAHQQPKPKRNGR